MTVLVPTPLNTIRLYAVLQTHRKYDFLNFDILQIMNQTSPMDADQIRTFEIWHLEGHQLALGA